MRTDTAVDGEPCRQSVDTHEPYIRVKKRLCGGMHALMLIECNTWLHTLHGNGSRFQQ